MVTTYPIPGFAEPVSSWTHLLGAGVFLVLGFFLIRRGRKNLAQAISLGVFALSCIFLLSMSGVFHLLPRGGAASHVLQKLDHAAIYALIAGTITAIQSLHFRGTRRWLGIALTWVIATIAIVISTVYFSRLPESLGLASYLLFGWMGVASVLSIWKSHGYDFVRPLLYGGLAYTIGAVMEFLREPIIVPGVIGPHEVFHVAVLLGISYHWYFIHASVENCPDALRRIGSKLS